MSNSIENILDRLDKTISVMNESMTVKNPVGGHGTVSGYPFDSNLYNLGIRDYIRDAKQDASFKAFDKAKEFEDIFPQRLLNYIAAVLDPEINYNSGTQVKQPSYFSTPSVSIPMKTLATIPSGNLTNICVAWNPVTFCTQDDLSKIQMGVIKATGQADTNVYANKICSVLYSVGQADDQAGVRVPPSSWTAEVRGIPDALPQVGVAKARLVSSKIKISFRGSALRQGGTIMGCATYQGPPSVIGYNQNAGDHALLDADGNAVTWGTLFSASNKYIDTQKDLCPFEEKLISNGIWAHNVNITVDASGITAVFIPSDPMDEIFYTPGTYYGEEVSSTQQIKGAGNTLWMKSNKGAHLNYLFNIQGLDGENTSPICIETYTTWEVIPTNQSASTLRNFANGLISLEEVTKVKEVIKEYLTESDGIHTLSKYNTVSGFTDFVKKLAKKVVSRF